MIYSIDISSDGVITENISDDLYLRKDFTLTVKAVNDAPIVLHPLEELYTQLELFWKKLNIS